jgi:hypothetical protein
VLRLYWHNRSRRQKLCVTRLSFTFISLHAPHRSTGCPFVQDRAFPSVSRAVVVLLYRGLAVVWDPSDPAVDDAPHPSAASFSYKDGIRELAASLRFFSIYGFDVPTPLVVTYPAPVTGPADVLEQTPVFTTVSGDGTVSTSALDCYPFPTLVHESPHWPLFGT